jgi:ABC-type bacteriocin/lantibiotic exporter with double-glycine peptidase domain
MNSTEFGRVPLKRLPQGLFEFVWTVSSWHQLGLALIATLVFLLSTAPLELQRRLVDVAVEHGATSTVALLAIGYATVALLQGAVKMVLNTYRAWASERAVRFVRWTIRARIAGDTEETDAATRAVELSMILSEAEPVGGFVGDAFAEPVLQAGFLLSVFAYMAWLQPLLAVVCLAVFSPQLIALPLLQRALNSRARHRIRALRDVSADVLVSAHSTSNSDVIDRIFEINMGIFKLKFGMNFLMSACHHLGVAAILGIGGWKAATGGIEIGTVVAFISGLVKLRDPWRDLVAWFREMSSVRVKFGLVVEALEAIEAGATSVPRARAA